MCKLTDSGLQDILKYIGDTLKYLDISNTPVTGNSLMGSIEKELKLEVLSCHGCTNLTKSGIFDLMEICCNLKALDILWTGVDDEGVDKLNLSSLEEFQYRYWDLNGWGTDDWRTDNNVAWELIQKCGRSLKFFVVYPLSEENMERIRERFLFLNFGFKDLDQSLRREGYSSAFEEYEHLNHYEKMWGIFKQ